MVKVNYEYRILCDSEFLMFILNLEETKRKDVLRKMLFIKSSSKFFPKEHIIILKEEINKNELLELIKNKSINIENIGGAIKTKELPEFLNDESDIISKQIRYAIFLTNDEPFRSYIFTGNKNKEQYLKNKNIMEIKTIIIKSEQEAIEIIDKYYREFTYLRELQR